jgi:hypothetical protein
LLKREVRGLRHLAGNTTHRTQHPVHSCNRLMNFGFWRKSTQDSLFFRLTNFCRPTTNQGLRRVAFDWPRHDLAGFTGRWPPHQKCLASLLAGRASAARKLLLRLRPSLLFFHAIADSAAFAKEIQATACTSVIGTIYQWLSTLRAERAVRRFPQQTMHCSDIRHRGRHITGSLSSSPQAAVRTPSIAGLEPAPSRFP